MNASWILITLAIVHFSKSESNWFTKGTVKTVTYNENGEQVTYEREMTDEERISLQKTINQAKDEIAGIGEKVVSLTWLFGVKTDLGLFFVYRIMQYLEEQTILEGSRVI